MKKEDLQRYYSRFKFGEDIFHQLMPYKIREILLVSSFYDAFIFEQDGRFSEQLYGEYHQLNLSSVPRITSVPTGKEAIDIIRERKFDMVITMLHIGEVTPFEMARKMKSDFPKMPILLLLNVQADAVCINKTDPKLDAIDDVFLWSGDSKVFLAMIKFVEDLLNVEHDTRVGLVRVILLVEDSVFYYSRFLPELCSEVMGQVQLLLSEELNDIQKNYRMRTRPKILMAHDYESAVGLAEKYRDYLLCVISDIRFPKNSKLDKQAGIKLLEYLKSARFDIPVLLQSAGFEYAKTAKRFGVSYIDKNSPTVIQELSDYIHWNLGFGDFIFRDESGTEYGRATDLVEFEAMLHEIPGTSLLYHSSRNDFSTWLIAHGEISVAKKVRPVSVDDFENVLKVREYLISVFMRVRDRRHKGKIVEFRERNLDISQEIVRLSQGSIGGKGRGIAFLNALLTATDLESKFPNLRVIIPRSAFIGTGEYDYFLKKNGLRGRISNEKRSDIRFKSDFLAGDISEKLRNRLAILLDHVKVPIAVRSSGLLEDSQAQPFAGIYQTYMLPNNAPDKSVRLEQLITAIKLVFASACLEEAKTYAELMHYNIEEEKMAVIIQEVVGKQHGEYFYPHISGVAQSYNYYPTSYAKHSDGVASIALGLGEWVVAGKQVFRFCPKYPKMDILPPKEIMKNSQREFFALDMRDGDFDLLRGEEETYATLNFSVAEENGVLMHLASVWDFQDNRLRDGLGYVGPRVLTFADILKYDYIPLAPLLDEILGISELAFGVPVEIEFAVTLNDRLKESSVFHLLQIRPLAVAENKMLVYRDEADKSNLLLFTSEALGNGVKKDLFDIIYVDPLKFNTLKTLEILKEIKAANLRMREEGRGYILIGPGRWGSRDRFLGIPVRWSDIDMAKVIVEMGIEGFQVDASQGTHFFHNLVATKAGYFNIPYTSQNSFIDLEWLNNQESEKSDYLVKIHREKPFITRMFGQSGVAVIEK